MKTRSSPNDGLASALASQSLQRLRGQMRDPHPLAAAAGEAFIMTG
jgi:hypothetical protein